MIRAMSLHLGWELYLPLVPVLQPVGNLLTYEKSETMAFLTLRRALEGQVIHWRPQNWLISIPLNQGSRSL